MPEETIIEGADEFRKLLRDIPSNGAQHLQNTTASLHAKHRQRLVRREFQRRQQRPAPEREQAQGGEEKALALHGG